MADFPVRANTKPAVDEIDRLIDALRKTGKQAGLSEAAIEKMVNEAKVGSKEASKGVGGLNSELGKTGSVIKSVGAGFATLFALDKIKDFVGEVIKVTAEFQKLEAVLTNTLGSKSEAQAAMLKIQELAKKTPFSVIELTESFVKLANRGVKPTMEQLTRLGDVAATLGKPFEQVVEAILDINNQVRWKEIGIKAETAGEKVRLSFRGMTIEADRTEQAVTDAVVALGELEGVSGAMAAISETLGGKISNLGDAWDQFLTTVGNGNNGILTGTVSLLTQAVDKARELLMTDAQNRQVESLAIYNAQAEKVKELYKQEGDADKAREIALANLHRQLEEVNKELEASSALVKKLEKEDAQRAFAAFSVMDELEDEYKRNNKLVNEYNDLVNEGQKAIIETTDALKKKDEAAKQAEINARLERERQERERINKELERKFRLITDIEEKETKLPITGNPDDALNPGAVGAFDPISDPYAKERADERARQRQEELDAHQEAVDMAKQYSIAAFNEVFNARAYNVQRELAMLQQQYNYEIGLAGNNEDAKNKIKQDFAKKEAQLQEKQARIQQQQALFQIAVSEGPAIAKTAQNLGFPLAIPFIAAIGFLFASQINRAKGVKQPRFAAEGDYDIKGPGTETSDDIPYMLSVRESVTPARATKRFGKLLRPMIENKDFNWHDVKDIVDAHLPTQLPPLIYAKAGADTSELRDDLREIRKAIENKQETRFQFDENGFGHWVGNKGQWTKYISTRYKM